MATYKIDSSLLTAQADEIRTLNGTTATMNPSEMTTALQSANAEVAEQEQKIIEITEMLQSRALPEAGSGGGSGGGTTIETCTVTLDTEQADGGLTYLQMTGYSTLDSNGDIIVKAGDELYAGETKTYSAIRNTLITIWYRDGISFTGEATPPAMTPYALIINGDCTVSYQPPCIARNTPILLANGITKSVQDIEYSDLLLVWDFDNGCYATAKPLWIKKAQTASSYYLCTFEDGTELKLVGSNGRCHRVFSTDRNMFESATECVGESIMTNNGVTKLISCERIDEPVEFYNIITDTHINLFAEGVLTSCRLNNLYPIKAMKFVKEDREVLPLEAYDGIDENFYRGLRLAEQKSENIEMINDYVANLYRLIEERKE